MLREDAMYTDNILDQLAAFQQNPMHEALIPWLIGATGSGKTQRVVALAKRLNLPVIRLLLGQHLPEDIGGIPRISKNGHGWITDFALTRDLYRAITEPVVLFMDEADKARPEVRATVLTAMSDREIRGQKFHPQTVIVMAGQELQASSWLSDETNQALAARCVFLPVVNDWEYVRKQTGMPLAWLKDSDVKTELPVMTANSRNLQRTVKFVQHAGLLLSIEERETVVRGALAGGDADNLMNELTTTSWLDLHAAFKYHPDKAIDVLDLNSLCESTGTMMLVLSDLKVYEKAFRRVFMSPDSTEAHRYRFMDNFFNTLEKMAPNQGDTVEILPGIQDEEFHQLMVSLVKEYNAGAEGRKQLDEAARTAAVKPVKPKKAKATS